MVLWAMLNCWSVNIVCKVLNTFSTGLFQEDVIIASSVNKHIWKSSMLVYKDFLPYFLELQVFERCFVVWSESHSGYIYVFFFAVCKGLAKYWMRVLISFKLLVERSAIQNWGSSHIGKRNISLLRPVLVKILLTVIRVHSNIFIFIVCFYVAFDGFSKSFILKDLFCVLTKWSALSSTRIFDYHER